MKFSIIIPVHNRPRDLIRSLNSLLVQTNRDFEVIVVDDHSTDATSKEIESWHNLNKFIPLKVIRNERRSERVFSRNQGMKAASGDWICWLDSDDEFIMRYLEYMSDAIESFPKFRIFNFGAIFNFHRKDAEFGTKLLKPFEMKEPHENFRSGVITTGGFIFHREVFNHVPLMTPSVRPYGDPGCFPEVNRNPNYPMREDGQWVPMGNPWGDDYHWFWTMTRKFESKALDIYPCIKNVRK